MQETDFQWFLAHYMDIYNKYGNSYVAIKNQTIIGVYTSYAEGVKKTKLHEKVGTFIIQNCNGNESGYTNYISSMNFL